MNAKQIKKIARIYAANVVYNQAGMYGGRSDLLTDEENERLCDELHKIADKMTHDPLNFAELDQIIKYINATS